MAKDEGGFEKFTWEENFQNVISAIAPAVNGSGLGDEDDLARVAVISVWRSRFAFMVENNLEEALNEYVAEALHSGDDVIHASMSPAETLADFCLYVSSKGDD